MREARTAAAEAAETDEEIDEEMNEEGEEQDDDNELEMEVDETDQATAPDQSTASARPERLSRIQKACLEFCIALLNHRITR